MTGAAIDMASGEATPPAAAPPLSGLTSAQARVRLARYGFNRVAPPARSAWLKEFARTLADPMAMMLAACSAVYYALGETTDALVLLAAIVPVLAVDVILGARARSALKKLAAAAASHARVIRDGRETEVEVEHLVPGDLMLVSEGGLVHADGVIRAAHNLAVDESQLTGESEPVDKRAAPTETQPAALGDEFKVFAPSRVLAGQATVEIVTTGAGTRYGQTASLVAAEAGFRPTRLQQMTAAMVRPIVVAALALSVALFVFRVMRGTPAGEAFLYAVSLAMSAVGEEFLLVLTLFLSVGAWRLSRRGVLVRRLASIETLGAVTVICLDKTGTLTSGEFALVTHEPLDGALSEPALLEAAALACEPNPADSMERAIVAHLAEHGVDADALHARWRLIHDHSFDVIGKHMSHVWREVEAGAARERIVAKGALEGILEHCETHPRESELAERLHAGLAAQGMRVLAVAGRETRRGEPGFSGERAQDERGLTLYGLLGFQDPLRPEVPAAVAECQRAGIRLKLITGDHALTAHAIAEAAGIAHDDGAILTGADLDRLPPERLAAVVRRSSIFARVRPEQKYAIVDALARSGEVVAMTGDGINDAPAMARADIGVSMGPRATEVARSVADLVLLRDDFAGLVATIHQGRGLYDDIQRAFRYLVGFKVMLVSLALAAPLGGLPLLLMPVDLVWLELIVHPVSALAFEGQGRDGDVMGRPPRDPAASIFAWRGAMRSAVAGALLAAAALALYVMRLDAGADYARAVAMTAAIAGSLALVWAEMAGERAWWRVAVPATVRFWSVIGCVAATVPLVMALPSVGRLLMVAPIGGYDFALAVAAALAAVAWRAPGAAAQSS
jgi:P-type Ca2+ transporter type 2C